MITAEDIAEAIERDEETAIEVLWFRMVREQGTWRAAALLWNRGCDLYDARHEEDDDA